LFIRADATTEIGTGHIMRCIALAQAWQAHGGEVTFLSHCQSTALRERIIEEGFSFISIDHPHPHPDDLSQTINYVQHLSPFPFPLSHAWLVLDGYHFTPDYQKAIRDAGIHLLVIDDMNHLPHYHADILLNYIWTPLGIRILYMRKRKRPIAFKNFCLLCSERL
jgi:spore coat polysaccharide biosynthesis predicted glycosyltransferase SpsG